MILLRVKYIYLIIMEILSKGIPFRQYSSNWNEMRTFPTCTLQVNFQWKLGYQNCCIYILLKCILMLKQIYYLFIAYHFPFIKSYFNHYYPLNSVFLKGFKICKFRSLPQAKLFYNERYTPIIIVKYHNYCFEYHYYWFLIRNCHFDFAVYRFLHHVCVVMFYCVCCVLIVLLIHNTFQTSFFARSLNLL